MLLLHLSHRLTQLLVVAENLLNALEEERMVLHELLLHVGHVAVGLDDYGTSAEVYGLVKIACIVAHEVHAVAIDMELPASVVKPADNVV